MRARLQTVYLKLSLLGLENLPCVGRALVNPWRYKDEQVMGPQETSNLG